MMTKSKTAKLNIASQIGKQRSLAATITVSMAAVMVVIVLALQFMSINTLQKIQVIAKEDYDDAMMEGYKNEIKSQVEASIAILNYYYTEYQAGKFTEAEAKELAKETIRNMRYREDNSGYMWIDDTDYTLVMHPILPQNEGNNRYELEDVDGVMIIQSIMKSVGTEDNSDNYNEFQFTKADGVTVAPKLAYSELFKPWNWVVTTGNYTDDMQAEMNSTELSLKQMFSNSITMSVVVSCVLILVGIIFTFFLVKAVVLVVNNAKDTLNSLAEGDLKLEVSDRLVTRKDELGTIGAALTNLVGSLQEVVSKIKDSSDSIDDYGTNFKDRFSDIVDSVNGVSAAIEEIARGADQQTEDVEVVNNKVLDLNDVIEQEKRLVVSLSNVVERLSESANSMLNDVKSLESTSSTTQKDIAVVKSQTLKTNESAKEISSAIAMISDIASQTNLLSLNASIEAARAGDAGRGFAIVADEIRNLSDSSTQGVEIIETAVSKLLKDAEESVKRMDETEQSLNKEYETLSVTIKAFNELYQQMNTVREVSAEINTLAGNLEDIKGVVSDSVTSLASITEESAASTKETSTSIQTVVEMIQECVQSVDGLIRLSNELKDRSSKFKL